MSVGEQLAVEAHAPAQPPVAGVHPPEGLQQGEQSVHGRVTLAQVACLVEEHRTQQCVIAFLDAALGEDHP